MDDDGVDDDPVVDDGVKDDHMDDDGVDDDLVVDQDDDNLFQKIGAFYFRNGPDSGCLAVVDGVGGYAWIIEDNYR